MTGGRWHIALRATLVCFGSLLTVAVASTPAAAHAKVVNTTPANGASVDGNLKAVTVVFDDPVRLVPHALVVTGGTGAPLPTGAPQVVRDRTLTAALHDRLVAGRYLVAWRILSDDGHVETGSFAFAVDVAGGVPAATPAMPPAPGQQPVWPVVVAAALAAVAVLGGALVVARGLRAVRAAAPAVAYPTESIDAESVRTYAASRHRTT